MVTRVSLVHPGLFWLLHPGMLLSACTYLIICFLIIILFILKCDRQQVVDERHHLVQLAVASSSKMCDGVGVGLGVQTLCCMTLQITQYRNQSWLELAQHNASC